MDINMLLVELANPSGSTVDGDSFESMGSVPVSRPSVSEHGSSVAVDSGKSSETSDSA